MAMKKHKRSCLGIQALMQQILSNSLVTHHFHQCPKIQKQFLEHLKGCTAHREEMETLRARAIEWACDVRRKLFGW